MIDVNHSNIDEVIEETAEIAGVSNPAREKVRSLIYLIGDSHPRTAFHSVRVGRKLIESASYLNGIEDLVYAATMRLPNGEMMALNTPREGEGHYFDLGIAFKGILHDIGKIDIPNYVLDSSREDWSEEKMQILRSHPILGYLRLMNEELQDAACLALTHHLTERPPYPIALPQEFYQLNGSRNTILKHSRLLSIADHNDACRRNNGKFGGNFDMNSPEDRKGYMYEKEPDQREIIDLLYEGGLLD